MIILGAFDELAPDMGFPSMKKSLEKKPYTNQETILQYLNNGRVYMVTASGFEDIFTGKATGLQLVHMSDGIYSWPSSIPYYVKNHNLRLPKHFEDHVLANR